MDIIPGHKLALWRTSWWSEVLSISLPTCGDPSWMSWKDTLSRHTRVHSAHNLPFHVVALPYFRQGWISQWQLSMLWWCASPEEGSGWFPGTSSSRQAWLLEQTAWLLIGGVGSREAKPQTEAASAALGTHKTKGQASHSHTMWRPPPSGQPMWGAQPPAVPSTDKM